MTTVDLWEVITTEKAGTRPYGMTFHDESTAAAFVTTMRRAGFEADLSPVFGTQPDLTAALAEAATFYESAALAAAVRTRKEHGL